LYISLLLEIGSCVYSDAWKDAPGLHSCSQIELYIRVREMPKPYGGWPTYKASTVENQVLVRDIMQQADDDGTLESTKVPV
jgi:hypothetical protein